MSVNGKMTCGRSGADTQTQLGLALLRSGQTQTDQFVCLTDCLLLFSLYLWSLEQLYVLSCQVMSGFAAFSYWIWSNSNDSHESRYIKWLRGCETSHISQSIKLQWSSHFISFHLISVNYNFMKKPRPNRSCNLKVNFWSEGWLWSMK